MFNFFFNLKSVIKNFYILERKNLFYWIFSFFVLGIYFFYYCFHKPSIYELIFIFLVTLILCYLSYKYIKFYGYLLLFFIIGYLIADVSTYRNKTVVLNKNIKFAKIIGEVSEIIPSTSTKSQKFVLKNVALLNKSYIKEFPTTLKLSTFSKQKLHKGDIIECYVNLFAPYNSLIPKGFNYKLNSYFKHIGANGYTSSKIKILINSEPKSNFITNFVNIASNYIETKINNNIDSKYAGVAIAVTKGGYNYINKQTMQNITNAGLNAIISISGYHIGLITILIFSTFRFILTLIPVISLHLNTKKLAAFFTIFIIIFYSLILGDIPPALRASFMAILMLLGIIIGIKALSIRNLILAVFVLLIFKPEYVLSIGFILSFTATTTLIMFLNTKFVIKVYYTYNKNIFIKYLKIYFIIFVTSIIVQLTFFPVLIYYFNSFQTYSLISNMIADPLFSLIIMPCLILGLILPNFIAIVFFKISEVGLFIIIKMADIIAHFNYSIITFPYMPKFCIVLFLFAFLIFLSGNKKLKIFAIMLAFIIYLVPFFVKKPNIMIDEQLNLVAFLQKNNQYVFSNNKGENFIKNIWFKNPKYINKTPLNKINNFNCSKNMCFYYINNIKVVYLYKNSKVQNICSLGNIIITQQKNNTSQCKSLLINKDFTKKYGSMFIYIKKNNIIIKSHRKNLNIKV